MRIHNEAYLKAELLKEINSLRNTMIHLGLQKGLNSPETLKISQELDNVLNKYQSLKVK